MEIRRAGDARYSGSELRSDQRISRTDQAVYLSVVIQEKRYVVSFDELDAKVQEVLDTDAERYA